MLELKIHCESLEEARIYLNATNYLSLLQDMREALRNAQKHGGDGAVLRVVQNFLPDIAQACDHSEGAY
jgi:nitrate/nitrite-specific signal transduction histidine kinase